MISCVQSKVDQPLRPGVVSRGSVVLRRPGRCGETRGPRPAPAPSERVRRVEPASTHAPNST